MLSTDQELWAARIRLHFEPPLRATAEAVTRMFVPYVGAQIKELRPETLMSELMRWMRESKSGVSSLDWVELVMAIEEDLGADIADGFAEKIEERTFRELVVLLAGTSKPSEGSF